MIMMVMMMVMMVMMVMMMMMMIQEVSGSEEVEAVWPGHQGSVQDVK